jgi:8-oxo-dGTP diphosphatase
MALEVCVAVVAAGGRLLVQRRPRGSHLAGAWEFPGGKRRPGERGRACAERECREETGLEVAAGREIARVLHRYPDRTVALRFFACEVRGGRLRRSSSLRWVAPSALRRLQVPEANRGVIRAVTQGLSRAAAKPRRGTVPGSAVRTT